MSTGNAFKKFKKIGQRTHRDRVQPSWNKDRGHLEHHKDYVLRAKDFHEKEQTLKKLQKSALDKNPDEFYHHMVNSETRDGIHFEKEKEDEETLVQKMMGDMKDVDHVRYKLMSEKKKIEEMKSELHFADVSSSAGTHTIFVDDDKQAKKFDPCKYFDTVPEMLGRKFNRLTGDDLSTKMVHGTFSKKNVQKVLHKHDVRYNELQKRIKRAKELEVVLAKLELKRHLAQSKGAELKPVKIKRGKADRAAVYQFPLERKR